MADQGEHPDVRYVVYPVHLDGRPTGDPPRLRHDPDCGHFEWGDGTRLGEPVLATEDQMRTLRACKSCLERRGVVAGSSRQGARDGRTGALCPTCYQEMALTGVCDNCS